MRNVLIADASAPLTGKEHPARTRVVAKFPLSGRALPLVILLPPSGQSGERRCPDQIRAISRAGPPVASLTLATPTTSVAPAAGTLSRLATFSRPQRPD